MAKERDGVSEQGKSGAEGKGRMTRLDHLLAEVLRTGREATIDADGFTREQVDRIYATAKASGVHASGTWRWILLRRPWATEVSS